MPLGDRLFRRNSRFDKAFDNVIKTDFTSKGRDVFPFVQRPAPVMERVKSRTGLTGSIADKYNIEPRAPEPPREFSEARGPPTSFGIFVYNPMTLDEF